MQNKFKVNKRWGIGAVLAVLVIVGLGIFLHLKAIAPDVSVSDLIQENTQNTSFKRPKQWHSQSGSTTSFSNSKGTTSPTGALGLQISQNQIPEAILNKPTEMRSAALKLVTNAQVDSIFKTATGVACNPGSSLKISADRSSSEKTIGLYNVSADCVSTLSNNALRLHAVVGRDGLVRTLILIARQDTWNRDQQAFKSILASVRESDQPTLTPSQTL